MAFSAIKLLDSATVSKHLKWEELIPAVETAMKNFSDGPKGGVVQPVRTTMSIDKHEGHLMLMPSYTEQEDVLTTKLLTIFDKNSQRNLPSHFGLLVLFDPASGIPIAIMDAEPITAMRTAAATAVALKHLCLEKPNKIAIFGAGAQGKSHCQVLLHVFPTAEIHIWNRTNERATKLAEEMKELGQKIQACDDQMDTVENADVIITTTSSTKPILRAEWLKPGCVIALIGACFHAHQEIDPILMKTSTIYVDTAEAAYKESGDIILNNVKIEGEIGELISGKKTVKEKTTIVYKSLGMAVEDAVSAKLVYNNFLKSRF